MVGLEIRKALNSTFNYLLVWSRAAQLNTEEIYFNRVNVAQNEPNVASLGPLSRGTLTVLLFTHADQILQDPDSLLHSLQLSSRPWAAALHCLQLLHYEWSQSVYVGSRERTAGVLKHRQQQLVTPSLNLW